MSTADNNKPIMLWNVGHPGSYTSPNQACLPDAVELLSKDRAGHEAISKLQPAASVVSDYTKLLVAVKSDS